jgi:hypothetical protein
MKLISMLRPALGLFVTAISFILSGCSPPTSANFLEKILTQHRDKFHVILENPNKYKVQVLYSRIDRDRHNLPSLTTFKYRSDPAEYFYPASTVKLPVALLALERINRINIPGLSKYSVMITDSAFRGQSAVFIDSTAENNQPSVAHYIKKIFLVSDNEAFNRLYEFLGQEYINKTLHQKGYEQTRILHRLSIPLSREENKVTNPVRFFNAGHQLVYQQNLKYATKDFYPAGKIPLGDGFVLNDSLVKEPMDFSEKNFIPLEELHHMLISLVFPNQVREKNRFNITEEDRKFLLRYMSMYPRESEDPEYGNQYGDNYCKFLIYDDQTGSIPENIRIFNKIGLAYGFLVETAYIVDFKAQIEFFLSAIVHVNENRIYNDGVYEYDSVGFPFMGNLGRVVYQYERNRKRTNTPDLSKVNFSWNHGN